VFGFRVPNREDLRHIDTILFGSGPSREKMGIKTPNPMYCSRNFQTTKTSTTCLQVGQVLEPSRKITISKALSALPRSSSTGPAPDTGKGMKSC
jgi:hypothetical protein